MSAHLTKPITAFLGHCRLAEGPLMAVAVAVKAASDDNPTTPILVFDDATGAVIDFDLRGTMAAVITRLTAPVSSETTDGTDHDGPDTNRGRGRPKLGVIPREVTLLPRHWDWLATQPGGASVTLRKLVETERRHSTAHDQDRAARDAAYRVMAALAGDLSGFEAASRALFARDREGFITQSRPWPQDVQSYVARLGFPVGDKVPASPVKAPYPGHLEPTDAAGRAFFSRPTTGPIIMLNLLRFHPVADYSAAPDLAPDHPISGRAAYARYMAHTEPFLTASGGRLLFQGECTGFFVGPADEVWDYGLLVEHRDRASFLGFASNRAYLAGIGHRRAALMDLRLLPFQAQSIL